MNTTKINAKIDWEKARRYMVDILPDLQHRLTERLKLQTLDAILSTEDFPPRINFGFAPKGDALNCTLFLDEGRVNEVLSSKEYIKFRDEINRTLPQIAEELGLKVNAGTFINDKRRRRIYINAEATYTFQPDYSKFEVLQ